MNIREFSVNLQKLYDEMSVTFSDLQKNTKLPCLPGCGACCLNPDIEATTLEMIPMALKIYDQGLVEEWHQKLGEAENLSCLMFDGKQCGSYHERPAVCRMFGVAGYFNKQHETTLSICKFIKEEYPKESAVALSGITSQTPVMAQWMARLESIDPQLLQLRSPINIALKSALEKVAMWNEYQA